MANLSTASGNVWITAPTYEDVIKIAELVNDGTGGGDYFTLINKDEFRFDEETKDFCRVSFPFCGCGRWAFTNNIHYSGRWIKEWLHIKKRYDDIAYLESIDWKMHYEYTDYECGCMLLGEGTDDVVHKANQDLSNTEFIEGEWEDFDYTYYNIMKVNDYTIDDLLEERDLLRFLDDEEDCGDSVEDFESELREFISDWASDKYISENKAKEEIFSKSSDFKELFELLEG